MLDILQGSPYEFLVDYKNEKHPMSNIKFVQSFWNFARLKKIKN